MENTAGFPKFECAISNTKEEYDSEVETFFTQLASLESDIGLLMVKDAAWKANYSQVLGYLTDLETSIIFKRSVPNSETLKSLVTGEDPQDEIQDILLRAKDEVPAILVRAQSRTRDVMTLYVRMSKVPRFAEGFTFERFGGLPSLRKALFRRAIAVSKQ